MEIKKRSAGFWNLVETFEGDKIIWMIVLLLIMISILAISSSTPLLAIQEHSTRTAIIREQLMTAFMGLGVIVLCYNIKRIWVFKFFAQFGFIFSLGLLGFLMLHIKTPFASAVEINGAWRVIKVLGVQVHVFEVVKVAMVMYLAWAVNAYKSDSFKMADSLAANKNLGFLKDSRWKLFLYIFLPILLICVLLLGGSASSTLFIGLIMFVTILIGGIKIKDMLVYGVVGVGLLAGCVGLYFVSGGKVFKRVGTAMARIIRASGDPETELLKHKRGTIEFYEALDKVRQPISAKVAVSEGGIIGKGPGRSTQRYVVAVMFEDYMFSFIVEEYGIVGAIIILILYCSLLARGSLVVRNCENLFAKTAIAGLVVLISGQALMHMFINVDLGPLTGQTLPMISHGKGSFLAFSIAFGIILSISRMAKKKIDRETTVAKPIMEATDEISAGITEVEDL